MGTGNVLSPHKYFQFERTLKNVVVNSESAFWITLLESHLLGLYSKDLGMTWMDWEPLMGAPQGEWPAKKGLLHGAPLAHLLSPSCPCEGHFSWTFLVFQVPPYPLGFPIKGGGDALSTLTLSQHTHAMHDLTFSLPASEIVS